VLAIISKVYEGVVSDETRGESMTNYFYDLPTTSKRRNRYIFPPNSPGSLKIANLPDLFSRKQFNRLSPYVYPRKLFVLNLSVHTDKQVAGFTNVSQSLYVIADLDSEDGLNLIQEALISLVC